MQIRQSGKETKSSKTVAFPSFRSTPEESYRKAARYGTFITLLFVPFLGSCAEPSAGLPRDGAQLSDEFTKILERTQSDMEHAYQECFSKETIAALRQCRRKDLTISRSECQSQMRIVAWEKSACKALAPPPRSIWESALTQAENEKIPVYK